jgi:hypothetical protein
VLQLNLLLGRNKRAVVQPRAVNAIDGNALYEIEQASQQLRDDGAERAYYARYNSSRPD